MNRINEIIVEKQLRGLGKFDNPLKSENNSLKSENNSLKNIKL
jgi:hypothetical protein